MNLIPGAVKGTKKARAKSSSFSASPLTATATAIILTVLKVLTNENKPLSQIIEEARKSFELGEVNFRVSNAPDIIKAVEEKYKDGQLSTLDGITVEFSTWRMNLRTSNTEPLLRLNMEAYDKSVLKEKSEEVRSLIDSVAIKSQDAS